MTHNKAIKYNNTTVNTLRTPDTEGKKAWQATKIPTIPPLTYKQKQFVKHVIAGVPKAKAYMQAYNHNGKLETAQQEASRTASKPQVKLELAKYSGLAETTVIEVMQYSTEYGRDNTKEGASYATVAVHAANSILDRVHGKATTKIEQSTSVVTLNIDLTGTLTSADVSA